MYLINVVWRFLIYIVVEPVLEEQIAMASPSDERSLLWVVVAIVVVGLLDWQAFAEVALVLIVECQGRVF